MAQSFRARRPFKGVGGIRQRQANLRWLRRSRKGVQSDSRPVLRIGGLPLFDFGKVAVGALQLLTPLPAVVVVRAPCQFGALFGLSSQEFHRSHVGTPRIPRLLHCSIYYFAMQRKLHCPSTGFGSASE
jgi:hypothetical protein